MMLFPSYRSYTSQAFVSFRFVYVRTDDVYMDELELKFNKLTFEAFDARLWIAYKDIKSI